MTLGAYQITQVNACGYVPQFTLTGQPDGLVHDQDASQFTLFTDDVQTAAEYTVSLVAQIQVPTEHTLT